jgi:3-deoxy-D-manno-octulosonic-acid transferase
VYFVYNVVFGIAFLLAAPYYLWKGRATGKYLQNLRERMGRLPVYLNVEGERSIWIHAVSVGEVLAARALIEQLKQRFPNRRVYLSTTTATGNAVARKSVRGLDGLFFAPLDFPRAVRKALATLNPLLLVIMETELWPNLIHEAKRHGARVALANGRISPRSFPRYKALRWFFRRPLGEVDLFLMQGEPHAQRIVAIGAPPERVSVPGNLKYDAVSDARPKERLLRIVASRPERPLLVAGSTVEGEEELVLRAFRRLRERSPEARLVLAPRHPERFASVPPLVEAAGFRCSRRSDLEPGAWQDGEVLLLDTLGELAQVYTLATVVFVGGSLVAAGGHNVLEAAAAAKPVVVGPHMENFQEIADEFREQGALLQVRAGAELGDAVAALFADASRRRELGERARAIFERNRGACARAVESLAGLVA